MIVDILNDQKCTLDVDEEGRYQHRCHTLSTTLWMFDNECASRSYWH